MEKIIRSVCWATLLTIVSTMSGCTVLPVALSTILPGVIPLPAIEVDSTDLKTEAAISKYLSGRELALIEGVWVHDKNVYEIVITENNFGIESDYQYIGILTRAERGAWKPGEVKLLIRETASDTLFTGVWFMGDRNRRNIFFMFENQNLVRANFDSADGGSTYLIRTFPKDAERSYGSEPVSSASGFFVSSDGYVITNNHVIEGARQIFVSTYEGDRLKATIVSQSKSTDLALLKIPYSTDAYLMLATANSAEIGDKVFTVGYPSTNILGRDAKYSEDVINSLSGVEGDATFLQISVPVQPGNSGGALVNREGQVIGVVTASAAIATFIQATGTLPQNVNWAVKADYVTVLSPDLTMNTASNPPSNPIQHTKNSTVLVEIVH